MNNSAIVKQTLADVCYKDCKYAAFMSIAEGPTEYVAKIRFASFGLGELNIIKSKLEAMGCTIKEWYLTGGPNSTVDLYLFIPL